jgi:hypothetical protein
MAKDHPEQYRDVCERNPVLTPRQLQSRMSHEILVGEPDDVYAFQARSRECSKRGVLLRAYSGTATAPLSGDQSLPASVNEAPGVSRPGALADGEGD